MTKVFDPNELSLAVAKAYNSRNLADLVALYEPDAMLVINRDRWVGLEKIGAAMEDLVKMPGVMSLEVNFCEVNGDLAVIRAEWAVRDGGATVMSGSSIELARRQQDGSWRYVIDHATGASLSPVEV